MKKIMSLAGVIVIGILVTSQVFAEQIGVPPEAMEKVSNITRHRGAGTLFSPITNFLFRVAEHRIQPGDKKPGPGYGVPEGHNIGNAPQPPVIGKVLDRSGRGNPKDIVSFIERLKK